MAQFIKIDPRNFNKHTPEGMGLLKKSVTEVGVIESIATDANGEIITGSARKEVFDELGLKPKFIKLKANEYPVIETKLTGEKRVKAAILANTVATKNINLDIELIQEVAVDIYDIEIEELGVDIVEVEDYSSANKELDQSDFDNSKCFFKLEYPAAEYQLLRDKIKATGITAEQIFYTKMTANSFCN